MKKKKVSYQKIETDTEIRINEVIDFHVKVNPNAHYLLVGQEIDGYVGIGVHEYSKFEELLINLPRLFNNLQAEGEWYISLYEIQPDTPIYYKKGRPVFPYPKRGKRIMYINYMNGTPDEVYLYPNRVLFYIYHYEKYNDPPMEFKIYINLHIEYPE